MRIAVASDKGRVANHFGHCEEFWICDVVDRKVTNVDKIPNPGHKPGFLPKYLHEIGTNVIISGGMGSGAVDLFYEKGIEVVIGAKDSSIDAVNSFIEGDLKSTGSICNDHIHRESNCHK